MWVYMIAANPLYIEPGQLTVIGPFATEMDAKAWRREAVDLEAGRAVALKEITDPRGMWGAATVKTSKA